MKELTQLCFDLLSLYQSLLDFCSYVLIHFYSSLNKDLFLHKKIHPSIKL